MKEQLDFTDQEKIQTQSCESDNDAILWKWKEVFMKGFQLCLQKSKIYDNEYFNWILAKIQNEEKITISEYNALEKITYDEVFFENAKQVFNRAIIFSRTIEEEKEFCITPETLRNYLVMYVYKWVVKDTLTDTLNDKDNTKNKIDKDLWLVLENSNIRVYKNNKTGKYVVTFINKTGNNENEVEIHEFDKIDSTYLNETWMLIAEDINWKILINSKWILVWPYYDKIDLKYYSKYDHIIVEDKEWKKMMKYRRGSDSLLNPDNITYKDINFEYLEKYWAIFIKNENKLYLIACFDSDKRLILSNWMEEYCTLDTSNLNDVWMVLLRKNDWTNVLLSLKKYIDNRWKDWIIYKGKDRVYYNDEKRKYYYEGLFGRKKYFKDKEA